MPSSSRSKLEEREESPPAPSTSSQNSQSIVGESSASENDESSWKDEQLLVGEGESDEKPRIILYSHKMKGLKDLLLAEKLNTHAISLQLTAQSQVQIGKKTRGAVEEPAVGVSQRPKRTRRD